MLSFIEKMEIDKKFYAIHSNFCPGRNRHLKLMNPTFMCYFTHLQKQRSDCMTD